MFSIQCYINTYVVLILQQGTKGEKGRPGANGDPGRTVCQALFLCYLLNLCENYCTSCRDQKDCMDLKEDLDPLVHK